MSEHFEDVLARAGGTLLETLGALERVQRRLHPPDVARLRTEIAPHGERLAQALAAYREVDPPASLSDLADRLGRSADLALRACREFCDDTPAEHWIGRILGSMRAFARALESLYPLHRLPPVGRFFTEPAFHDVLASLDPDPPADGASVGLHSTGDPKDPGERGGFVLYVPEHYDPGRAWPLVVALHGGSGSGRDFLWAWLREAKGRGFLLLAPTAIGPTWSMMGPDVDAAALHSMVEYVGRNWRVNSKRVLLTGLSDGATYGLTVALREGSPFTAVAAIAGVLHPRLLDDGGLAGARGRRVYLVHGALDWMFSVEYARSAHRHLADSGVDVVYREIADLSHTYPREENDRILEWLDPSLALPTAPAAS